MFSRVNPIGWALFEELTSAQMNQLDINASRAIDGTFGGTYTPSGPININGMMSVTNMNITNLSVENASFSSVGTFNAGEINCYRLNCTLQMNLTGEANFEYYTYFRDDVRMQDGSFFFSSPYFFKINNGVFVVYGTALARFETDVDFAATADVVVQAGCDWTWYNTPSFQNGFNVYGGQARFVNKPYFADGVLLASGKLINYTTIKYFIIRWPFSLGGYANNTNIGSYYQSRNGKICQVANSAPGFYSQMHPGLSGGTSFNVTQAEFRCRGNELSGSTVGPTLYELNMFDENMSFLEQKLAYDNSPNSATAHVATWLSGSAPLVVDPNINILGIMFNGYNGGDTLNGTTKWYELLSCRLTCSTMAMGVF